MSGAALARLSLAACVAAVIAAIGACGGSPSKPSAPVIALTVLVTNDQGQLIANAQVKVLDGPNAGRTATTDTSGKALLSNLVSSGFTVEVTASGYGTATQGVTVTGAVAITVKLSARPPNITGLTASSNRAEPGDSIQLTATVRDDPVPADQLTYQWSSTAGTFTGTGPSVQWQAPKGPATPADYVLTLTVSKKVSGPAGNSDVSATADVTVHVNDSYKEIKDLALTFFDDFTNFNVSPETCVRNFTDSCPGKAAELSDIQYNRTHYHIESGTYSVQSITLNSDRTSADVVVPCTFRSIVTDPTRPTNGQEEVSTGICTLTAVYEGWHWWLCDSHDRSPSAKPGFRIVF